MTQLYGWAVAAIIALVLAAWIIGYSVGWKAATDHAELAEKRMLVDALKAELDAKARVRELERELVAAQTAASEMYEKGKRDAEATGAAVVADLRAGNIQLQRRWAGCETMRVSDSAASTAELDAAARDREESAGRIVRAAAQCDSQVRSLQNLLTLEREHVNKQ